jgi:penicillin amidase
MKKVVWVAAAVFTALLAGCSSAHISLGQPSAVSVPVGTLFPFNGQVQDSNGTIVWRLDGPGSLSNATGPSTVYTAPSTYDPANNKATLTAFISTAPDQKQVVAITIIKPSTTVDGGIPDLVSAVTVTYDERDIPTITCAKSVDCYAVLGFIHARDRLFQMDFYRRVGEGRISELVGEGGLAQDVGIRTFFTTRDGHSMLEELTAHTQEDPLLAPVLAAYVAGVNAYIAQIRADPSKLPAAYKQLQYVINPASTDDLPDWTAVDSLAVGRLFQFQLSENAEGEGDYGKWVSTWAALIGSGTAMDPAQLTIGLWIQSKSPIEAFTLAGSGAANAPSLVAQPSTLESLRSNREVINAASEKLDALRAIRALRGEPAGSNNWVVDGQHTDLGKAFVQNDPHQPLTYPSNFHLSHLIGTEDGLNVLGACFPGVPVALTGRGAHVGWGVTVVGYDVTDLYVETLAALPDGGPAVSFQGQPIGIINVPQTYKFRTATGLAISTTAPKAVQVSPPHGPIISAGPTAGTAISVRWTGQEVLTDDVRAFLRLNSATSVEDGRLALEGDPKPDGGSYTGYYTGAQNFVLADDQGNIAYVPHACVPQRPWASSPAVYPLPVVPMDGRGMFEWASGPDGGLLCVPNDKLPRAYPIDGGTGSNKGYLATANFDPLGVSADNNPYSNNPGGVPYLSFEWDDLGFRIARIQEVLDTKLADAGKVTQADMQALQTDHVVIAARPFIAYIQALSQGGQIPDGSNSAAAAAILFAWAAGSDGGAPPLDCPTGLAPGSLDPASAVNDSDPTNSANSKACLLFHTFLRRVLESTFTDEEAVAGVGRAPGNEVRALLTLLSGQVPNPNNVFCRDVGSNGAPLNSKTCQTQVLDALGFAYAQLKGAYGDESNWRWGRVHTLTFEFIVSGYPLIDRGFRPGPFPRPGGAWTVDVGRPTNLSSDTLSFPYGSGGAVRWLAAMDGNVAHTFNQLPGVQNSNDPYPFDQSTMLTDWVQNKYFNWPFNAADVTSVRTETFSP